MQVPCASSAGGERLLAAGPGIECLLVADDPGHVQEFAEIAIGEVIQSLLAKEGIQVLQLELCMHCIKVQLLTCVLLHSSMSWMQS